MCRRAGLSPETNENSSEHQGCGRCRFWNHDGACPGGAPRLAEVSCPNIEVGVVDAAVAVAVGGQVVTGAAQRVAPHVVIGGVDHAVLVKIA